MTDWHDQGSGHWPLQFKHRQAVHSDRIETWRGWRTLVAVESENYRLNIARDATHLIMALIDRRPFGELVMDRMLWRSSLGRKYG